MMPEYDRVRAGSVEVDRRWSNGVAGCGGTGLGMDRRDGGGERGAVEEMTIVWGGEDRREGKRSFFACVLLLDRFRLGCFFFFLYGFAVFSFGGLGMVDGAGCFSFRGVEVFLLFSVFGL